MLRVIVVAAIVHTLMAALAPSERDALVSIYNATIGSGWINKAGWADYGTSSDPCDQSWLGVACLGTSPT